MIGDQPFLVVNSDNFWLDGPVDAIRLLGAAWDDARMDALLLLVPLARANCHGGRGDFHLARDGRITKRRAAGRVAPFTYIGIQILSPRVIADWPEGPVLDDAVLGAGDRGRACLSAWCIRGCGSTSAPRPRSRSTEAMLADG